MRNSSRSIRVLSAAAVAFSVSTLVLPAQSAMPKPGSAAETPQGSNGGPPVAAVAPPPDYVIGPEDILTVFFWREPEISGDVIVRPDGKISLKLINELQAAGLTPDQLRQSVLKQATPLFNDPPNVSVTVKQINSRKVFITGAVAKPGAYPLLEPMTVLQLIIKAGGLTDFADKKHISVVRAEKRPDGQNWSSNFNYTEIQRRVNLKQNVELKPGDTVIVPD